MNEKNLDNKEEITFKRAKKQKSTKNMKRDRAVEKYGEIE
jgi:hypothetical protein